jgi:hypothetical protein
MLRYYKLSLSSSKKYTKPATTGLIFTSLRITGASHMERLSAHRALQLATLGVSILKELSISKRTMTPKEFGQAIGLVRQAWKPHHGQAIADVLEIIEATFARFDERVECHRVSHSRKPEGHWHQQRWIATNH